MSARCSYARCGSFGLNIAPASGLCDAHFYKVQRDELLAALNAMLTHMGMDEDEWNKPTFDQARAAIAKAGGAK